jgi:ATPase subunit of ABC transporter with duplicated ATPase domains
MLLPLMQLLVLVPESVNWELRRTVRRHAGRRLHVASDQQPSTAATHGLWAALPFSQFQAIMIRLENISKQNGHQILFIEASAALQRGEKIGLVGPNGAGKTTLFRLIAGRELPDEGQVSIDRGVTIGYFSQDVGEMSGRSAVSEVMDGAGPVSVVAAELSNLEAAMADPDRDDLDDVIARYGEVQGRFEELGGYALDSRAREVLAGLNFSQEMMDGDVGALSGGWKMRVALARILLMNPDAMLLDEPSNHLDLESLIWLEEFLKGYEGVLFMTSHDYEFMNRIVTKVVEIDGGSLTTYSGNYEFYEQQRALNERQQQAQFERQQAMLAKEIKFIERFKARASHAAQVQSRVKKLDKIDRVEPPRRRHSVEFNFPAAPRSGEDVASLRNVSKRYGSRSIYEGFDFQVRRKERWCVMGVNGAGKSTLLKLVAGSARPDEGSVTLGGSVKMGYFAQHAMELLDGEDTVFQSLEARFPQAGQGSLRALAGCFGFSGDDVEKRCRVLSGGEKARLVMAQMLYDPPNFLVLDEPTNHLDMQTKEMLIKALSNYEGTMLFVSHDRHFLAALSNRVLELTPEGVHQYGGGYSEYVARTGHEAPGLHPLNG